MESLGGWRRTHSCGALRSEHVGQAVTLMGWAYRRRDHGGLLFIDLRDRDGLTQCVFNPEAGGGTHAKAEAVRTEFVLAVRGTVSARPPGTENVTGIVGLGKAAELARLRLAEDSARLAALRDRLERGLVEKVPHARRNGSREHRTPNTANITFPFVEGEALVIALDLKGLACSTGAACSSGAVAPSHVLTAIGLPAEEARATLRFSLGHANTEQDVDFALSMVPGVVEHLRELSPLYKKPVATL